MAVAPPKVKKESLMERIYGGLSPFGIKNEAKIRNHSIEEAAVAAAKAKGLDPYFYALENFKDINVRTVLNIAKKRTRR